MKCLLALVAGAFVYSSYCQDFQLRDHVRIVSRQYESKGVVKLSVRPEIVPGSVLSAHEMRFLYLLNNLPPLEIYTGYRDLFPDSATIEANILRDLLSSEKFMENFNLALQPFLGGVTENYPVYSVPELMEVASKFYYCDKIRPDNTVQVKI